MLVKALILVNMQVALRWNVVKGDHRLKSGIIRSWFTSSLWQSY